MTNPPSNTMMGVRNGKEYLRLPLSPLPNFGGLHIESAAGGKIVNPDWSAGHVGHLPFRSL